MSARWLFIFVPISCALSQPLDWSDDVVAFGTDENEIRPALTISPGGAPLRAFCIREESAASNRVSTTGGITWESFSDWESVSWGSRIAACADRENFYALLYAPGTYQRFLQTFNGSETEWLEADRLLIADDHENFTASAAIISDVDYSQDDPYLSIAWMERFPGSNDLAIAFCQSRDQGITLTQPVEVIRASDNSPHDNELSIAVSWQGENETLWIAASLDRPGSVGESVRLFSSSNQGADWSAGMLIDSSAYPQLHPGIAANGSTILTAYARRNSAFAQKDIYFVFSLDGGAAWTEPAPLTDNTDDEFNPRIVISHELQAFAIFYLSAAVNQEPATLYVRAGQLSTPWQLSAPVAVSEMEAALRSGDYAASAGPDGFAALWSGPGILGDHDVFFDAAWLGETASRTTITSPAQYEVSKIFPNPFNGSVSIQLDINHSRLVSLSIHDLLGRKVHTIHLGLLSPGRHQLQTDLSAFPSGTYLIRAEHSSSPPILLLHLK